MPDVLSPRLAWFVDLATERETWTSFELARALYASSMLGTPCESGFPAELDGLKAELATQLAASSDGFGTIDPWATPKAANPEQAVRGAWEALLDLEFYELALAAATEEVHAARRLTSGEERFRERLSGAANGWRARAQAHSANARRFLDLALGSQSGPAAEGSEALPRTASTG